MASCLIHLAVANEVNKVLKRDKTSILVGSIAPDISKLVNQDRSISHFTNIVDEKEEEYYLNDAPDISKFLKKYKTYLDDDFVLGYYIHLYTDYLWFKYFVPDFIENGYITKLDGTKHKLNGEMASLYIYNDYTNLNGDIFDKFDMDIKIFSNELPEFKNIIEEIPMDKLNILMDKMSMIIGNMNKKKELVFNMDNIYKFVETATNLVLAHYNSIKNTQD